jgi:hypothetical protein
MAMARSVFTLLAGIGTSAVLTTLAREAAAWTPHATAPGCATSIGATNRGAFITGCTSGGVGGDDIFILLGNAWTQAPGQGVDISADGQGDLAVVNAQGNIYVSGPPPNASSGLLIGGWSQLPGCGTSIGTSESSFGTVVTGCTQESTAGYGIYYYAPGASSWVELGGQATQVAVNDAGDLWVVNAYGQIYYWNGSGWVGASGCATSISVDPSGNVWVVGCTSTGPNGNGLYESTDLGTSWTMAPGSQASKVSVAFTGDPWTIDATGAVYHWTKP